MNEFNNKLVRAKVHDFAKLNAKTLYPLVLLPIGILSIISTSFSEHTWISIVLSILSAFVAVLINVAVLDFYRDDAFDFNSFKTNEFDKKGKDYFVLTLLMNLMIFLWTLLFIIPGIVKSIAYLFAPHILKDNKGMTPKEAISKSVEMTDGKKTDLFLLSMSYFIVPAILLFLTGLFASLSIGTAFFGALFGVSGGFIPLLMGLLFLASLIGALIIGARNIARWEVALSIWYEYLK